jgi:hypothetical protein
MNETVWAGEGFGNADERNTIATTSSDSFAEVLVISGISVRQELLRYLREAGATFPPGRMIGSPRKGNSR